MIITILSIFLGIQSILSQQCDQFFMQRAARTIELSQERDITFSNVEVFRRNNQIGQQQMGELRLTRWIELKPYSDDAYNYVGIAENGIIYHVIDWNGTRRIARPLSGLRQFDDLLLLDNQVLVATDANGQISLYSPIKWAKSPFKKLIKRTLLIWSGVSALSSLAFQAYLRDLPEAAQSSFFLSHILPSAFATVLTGLQSAFVMGFQYEKLNAFPDGFIPTQLQANNYGELRRLLRSLNQDDLEPYLLEEDLSLPDPGVLPPVLPEGTTEPIRK